VLQAMAGARVLLMAVALILRAGSLAAQDEDKVIESIVLEGRERHLSAYPYAYYTPETELAFGAGGILTFYTSQIDPDLRPSKISLSGYYSTRGQYKITQTTHLYFDENRYLIMFPLSFGSFVDKYWGVGNQTADIANVDYDVQVIEGSVVVEGLTGLAGFTRDGFVYRGSYRDIKDLKDNPNLTESTVGVDGGFSSGFGFDFVVDSRDAVFYPTVGGYHHLDFVWYTPIFLSDYRYTELEIDLRRYFSLSPSQVLAAQFRVQAVFGQVPFYDLPALGGGSIMRGYYEGRYRDLNAFAGQVEYRRDLWWRLGMVLFAGVGEVFGSEENNFAFSRLQYSLGGGLRFLFDTAQHINLRVDLGFGKDSNGIYFGLEEAF